MSKKHNYTNYAAIHNDKEEAPVVEAIEPEVVVEEVIEEVTEVVEVPVVEELVTEPAIVKTVEPKKLTGTVVDCDRLNVRKGPSTTNSIVGVLTKGTEVTIESEKNKNFYEISTSEVKGYCMKQYIKLAD